MNFSICASLKARTGSCSGVGMKILISLSQSQSPAQGRTGRLIRSKGSASGHTATSTFIFRPPKAAPSAAQEEDRRDIEDTDHHGASSLHYAMSKWQWSSVRAPAQLSRKIARVAAPHG